MHEASVWIAEHQDLGFNDFPVFKYSYADRMEMYEYVFKSENLGNQLIFLEFGVAQGNSFSWWVANNHHPDSRFYGFDTFTGLPEAWNLFDEGHFDNDGKAPIFLDERCQFIKGLFQDTLFKFKKEQELTLARKIIHVDSDLYTSAMFVLTAMADTTQPGDIIIFEDFRFHNSEFEALMDFSKSYRIEYEVLTAVNNYSQVAIKIL